MIITGHLGQVARLQTSYRDAGTLTEMVKCIIPKLSYTSHKGECGRIGVVGGCQE